MGRGRGEGFDGEGVKVLGVVFEGLDKEGFESIDEGNVERCGFGNFGFLERYLWNYIEGREFEIEDGREIIERGEGVGGGNGDCDEVVGSFEMVGSGREMRGVGW